MPAGTVVAKVEEHLKRSASKKKMKGRRKAKYVYGALNNMGMMRGNKPTAKGVRRAHRSILD